MKTEEPVVTHGLRCLGCHLAFFPDLCCRRARSREVTMIDLLRTQPGEPEGQPDGEPKPGDDE